MTEWKTYRLGDILNFRRGHDLPKTDMVNGEIPVAGSNGIIGSHNVSTPIEPCITIGRSGNVGTPYIYDKCWAHNTVLYVDDFKGNDPLYLYYLLKTIPLASYGGGSAVPTLNRNHIHPIEIKHTPSLEEQRRIAGILGAIDDKIENNRRINTNLELQAQALYKQWFVDNRQDDWRTYKLNDITLHITDGVHNTVKDSPNGEYYLLSCKNIKNGTLSIGNNERRIDTDTFARLRKRTQLAQGDILVTSVGTVGEMFLVNELPMNYEFQRSVAIIKPNQDIVSSYFLYATLLYLQNEIKHLAHGAVQQCIFISDLKEYSLVLPNKKETSDFGSVVSPIFDKITKLQRENINLTTLRDTLLPKLMNGELSVNNFSVD